MNISIHFIMIIDGITRTEITRLDKIIVLHDQHVISFKTSRWLLDVIGRGVYEVTIDSYTEVDPLKILSMKCPCSLDDEIPCDMKLNVNDFYERVNKHLINITANRSIFKKLKIQIMNDPKRRFLDNVRQQIQTIAKNKNREIYKNDHNMSDCPKCINSVDITGLGKQIPPRSDNPTVDIHQCQTCKNVYCVKCSAVFDLNEIHDHTLITCVDYVKLQSHLRVTKYVKCPKCNIKIGKIDGCNHMTCRCKAEFCFVCGVELDRYTKQTHFTNDPNSSSCQQFDSQYRYVEEMAPILEHLRLLREAYDENHRIRREATEEVNRSFKERFDAQEKVNEQNMKQVRKLLFEMPGGHQGDK